MRRLIIAALLCSTATSADAAPVGAFIGGFLNALGAGTFLTSGAVGAWGAGFSIGSLFGGTVLGRLALTIGLNAITARLSRPKLPTPQDRMVNTAQPLAFMERIYGRVRKGGPKGFTGFFDASRNYAVIIAAHSTKGPVTHWLDESEAALDGLGRITTPPFFQPPSSYYAQMRVYTGKPGQTVDGVLDAYFPEVTSEYNFKGLSYAVIRAAKPPEAQFSDIYPNGREWNYAPVWDGDDLIFDPRDGLTKWTDNAALIIAKEAAFHGKQVDPDILVEEANACDVMVANADGGTQKKWTINTTFDDSMTWETCRQVLELACDAWFYETPDGQVGFKVGRYTNPTLTLTDRSFLSVERAEKEWGADQPGEFSIRYVEPERKYRESSSGAIVMEAGSARAEEDCYAINSHNQACRVAKRMGLMSRPRFNYRGIIKLIGYEMIGQRFVRITHAGLGFDDVVEVRKLIRLDGGLTFQFEAISVTPEDFDFDALSEEPPRPASEEVVSDATIPNVTGLSGAVVTGTGGVAQIEWSWPAQGPSYKQEFRIRAQGATAWQTFAVGDGQLSFLATGLVDGGIYEGQVRNRSASGKPSEWTPLVPLTVTAIANTTPPGALVGFAATVSSGSGLVAFTSPASANYIATRIYRGTTTTFSASALVRTEYGAAGTADSWLNTGLPPGTYSFWGEAINASGIAGARSGPSTITII